MSVTGESSFLKSYLSGADGRFYFSLNDLYGEKEIVLFCDYPSDDLQIVIDGPFSQDFTGLPDQGFRLDDSWRSFIEKQMINHQLSSLYNSRRDSLITSKKEAAKPFYTQPDLTIRMENYILLPNMEEVFRELVKQVLVTRQEGRLALNVLDYNTNRIIGPKPAFFIDGVPFFDPAVIFEMDPESIEEINIVSHKYYKGILEMDGIVDIRTKQGDLPISEMPANYLRYPFQGYQQILGYNGPDYSDEQKLKSRIPDFRNLLYWDPSVKTGSDGKAYISFFTSDNTGRYTISLEGISPDGLFTSVSCSFMVTK
jgi:hypothetical protein